MSDVADLIHTCEAWKLGAEPELLEDQLLPELRGLAAKALKSGDARTIVDWFDVYSKIDGIADEELTEISLDLIDRYPELVSNVRAELSPGAAARPGLLFGPMAMQAFDGAGMQPSLADRIMVSPAEPKALFDSRPVLGEFARSGTFESARDYPVVSGTLTVRDRARSEVGRFATNTGDGAPSGAHRLRWARLRHLNDCHRAKGT